MFMVSQQLLLLSFIEGAGLVRRNYKVHQKCKVVLVAPFYFLHTVGTSGGILLWLAAVLIASGEGGVEFSQSPRSKVKSGWVQGRAPHGPYKANLCGSSGIPGLHLLLIDHSRPSPGHTFLHTLWVVRKEVMWNEQN